VAVQNPSMFLRGRVILCTAVIAGCRSHGTPVRPPPPPAPRYLIGDICLNKDLKRVTAFPHFLVQGDRWIDEPELVHAPLAERPQRFTWLGFEGNSLGNLVTDGGAASVPGGFAGTYRGHGSGGGACSYERDGVMGAYWTCIEAGGCSLAVAPIASTSPPPPAIEIAMFGACIVEGTMVVDVNGDGTDEAFALSAFVAGATAAEDVHGKPDDGPPCERFFAWHAPKKPAPAVDVLGIADLDADGTRELVIAIRAGMSRTVAVYRASDGGTRLRRIAVFDDRAWRF
jgi:hypothetical protein